MTTTMLKSVVGATRLRGTTHNAVLHVSISLVTGLEPTYIHNQHRHEMDMASSFRRT